MTTEQRNNVHALANTFSKLDDITGFGFAPWKLEDSARVSNLFIYIAVVVSFAVSVEYTHVFV